MNIRPAMLQNSWLILLILTILAIPAQAASPRIMVSIKPIHSLVAGVMQGVGEPDLLITGTQSPHTFNLRPSDVKKLNSAELIIWVGEGFETFLTHTLASLPSQTRIVKLMGHAGVAQLPIRQGGVWEKRHHHRKQETTGVPHTANQKEPHHSDPHIWLSPTNARTIVGIVKEKLSEIDPDNAARYQQNARNLKNQLNKLDQELLERLSKVQWIPFIVFHDAYQFFERHYTLNVIGSITLSPERMPGAKRIHEIRAKLKKLGVRCIFSEPQFEPKLIKTIVEGTEVRTGTLDPLGAELPAGTEAYFSLMRNLTSQLVACLEEKP